VTDENNAERAREILGEILNRMGFEAQVETSETDERISLEIKGPDAGLVIGKKGQTLDALQHLVAKVVLRGREPDSQKPIQVDTEGYRARREDTLTSMAHRLAEKVRETGRSVEVDPMSAADRRIIHLALREAPGVSTRSEGEGMDRRLIIEPAAAKG
jgi:spoIIIJ-associated protein